MTEWQCPNCGGGFPDAVLGSACPWCEQSIDGSYEGGEKPTLSISRSKTTRVKSDCDREQDKGFLSKSWGLFK